MVGSAISSGGRSRAVSERTRGVWAHRALFIAVCRLTSRIAMLDRPSAEILSILGPCALSMSSEDRASVAKRLSVS